MVQVQKPSDRKAAADEVGNSHRRIGRARAWPSSSGGLPIANGLAGADPLRQCRSQRGRSRLHNNEPIFGCSSRRATAYTAAKSSARRYEAGLPRSRPGGSEFGARQRQTSQCTRSISANLTLSRNSGDAASPARLDNTKSRLRRAGARRQAEPPSLALPSPGTRRFGPRLPGRRDSPRTRIMEPGEIASPTRPVVLARPHRSQMGARLCLRDRFGKTASGMAATISVDAFPQPLPGLDRVHFRRLRKFTPEIGGDGGSYARASSTRCGSS